VLAGGSGTRLRPLTQVVSKQLLPVYDKPMVYYPISTLIHAGVREILIIGNPNEIENFKKLLSDGSQFGVKFDYLVQDKPAGVAQGIELSAAFLDGEPFWYILGDNLFHGPEFGLNLRAYGELNKAQIFAYRVNDPSKYGVAVFGDDGELVNLVEKPCNFVSSWAIPGLYFFPNIAVELSRDLEISERGEYEIIDLIELFFSKGELLINKVSRGNAWFDMGTADSLLKASLFVEMVEARQGLMVGSPEEAAYSSKLISLAEAFRIVDANQHSEYYQKLALSLSAD
jgi:glucose-1-phosphate thymidylyltransferase